MVIFNSFWLVYQKVQALETTLKWDAYPSTYGRPYGPTVVSIRLRGPQDDSSRLLWPENAESQRQVLVARGDLNSKGTTGT